MQNVKPQSVIWGRTNGSALSANVRQEGNDLVIRNSSAEQDGNYICTITHTDGTVEYIHIHLNYKPGKKTKGNYLFIFLFLIKIFVLIRSIKFWFITF